MKKPSFSQAAAAVRPSPADTFAPVLGNRTTTSRHAARELNMLGTQRCANIFAGTGIDADPRSLAGGKIARARSVKSQIKRR